jgi:hypothetical protein
LLKDVFEVILLMIVVPANLRAIAIASNLLLFVTILRFIP